MSKIARLIIASGESSPDMRYAAGFSTPDEFIWFEANGDAGVICSPLEFSRAVKQARPGVTVYTEAEFGGPGRIDMLKNLAARAAGCGLSGAAGVPASVGGPAARGGAGGQGGGRHLFPGARIQVGAGGGEGGRKPAGGGSRSPPRLRCASREPDHLRRPDRMAGRNPDQRDAAQ